MKDIILKVDNISKQYRLGQVGTGSLLHDINRWWHTIRGLEDPYLKIGDVNDRSTKGESDYVWALKDINFEIARGEVVGIIGKNGAGKSTLLKLLSRVTAPTTGSIKFGGRVASLLEVGTGFNGEMSGRENIYLNGAILGMTKKEITSKLDEIIDFSGCERYIDTPVKRYSSGMYVRLAFAVAAFLEPEILIVDEVLAVGDAEFQKKAIGKMQDISRQGGRTVLFVSHNMAAVKSLCTRGIVLENGKVVLQDTIENVISYYLKGRGEALNYKQFDETFDKQIFKLNAIALKNKSKTIIDPLYENDEIEFLTDIDIKVAEPLRYHITYHLHNQMGEAMFSFSSGSTGITLKKGNNQLKCFFPKYFFQSGQYFLSLFVIKDNVEAIFVDEAILAFNVVDRIRELGTYMGREPGSIRPTFIWENQ